jgi:uncharacterized protein YjbI with pentapeptide repeats
MTMHQWRQPDDALRERLRDSRTYWQSEGGAGAPLVAHNEDLAGLDLGEQILVEAQLQGADLRGTRLAHAQLMRAALDGANMAEAVLFDADLSKATAATARFEEVTAARSLWRRADVSRASMIRADLTDARLEGVQALMTDLRGSILQRADLRDASLLGARLEAADLTDAFVDGLLLDVGALQGVIGLDSADGEWAEMPVAQQRRSGAPRSPALEWELRVGDVLRALPDAQVHHGVPDIDFVVMLPGSQFVAVEAMLRARGRDLESKTRRANVVVVPDEERIPATASPANVIPLRELHSWFKRHATGSMPPYGAYALIQRQADRLRAYHTLEEGLRRDPAAVSRIVAWLDARQDDLLTSADRRLVAAALPAHLDSEAFQRAIEWTRSNRRRLENVLDVEAQLRQDGVIDAGTAREVAVEALRLEKDLAATVGPRP